MCKDCEKMAEMMAEMMKKMPPDMKRMMEEKMGGGDMVDRIYSGKSDKHEGM